MPEWVLQVAFQIPMVIGLAWYFDRREQKLKAEQKQMQADHLAELDRRTTTLTARVNEWKDLYDEERRDRIEAQRSLAATTAEVRGVLDALQDLTREVIRNAGK